MGMKNLLPAVAFGRQRALVCQFFTHGNPTLDFRVRLVEIIAGIEKTAGSSLSGVDNAGTGTLFHARGSSLRRQ